MPLYCAYCGKEFTRQEHLERHILTHTNIRPYRCLYCQLSFTRKDLLHRHMMKGHESKGHTGSLPEGVCAAVTGRTLIACQNCASAKTGCDKKVPCSRCAEKNLQCAARYARRSSKTTLRAAQVTPSINRQIAAQSLHKKGLQHNSSGVKLTGSGFDMMAHGSPQLLQNCTAPQANLAIETQNTISSLPDRSIGATLSDCTSSYLGVPEGFKNEDDWSNLLSWPESPMLPLSFDLYGHETGPAMQVPLPSVSDTSTILDQVSPSSLWSTSTIATCPAGPDGIQRSPDVMSILDDTTIPDSEKLVDSQEGRVPGWSQVAHAMTLQKFRQSGMLEQPHPLSTKDNSISAEQQWASWSRYEEQNKLIYNWVMMDQELNLFYDTGPMLSVADLERSLPKPETVWASKTSLQFFSNMQKRHSGTEDVNLELHSSLPATPSLNQLFKDFLSGDLSATVSPQYLHLLLYPLQSLVYNLRHLLSCIDGPFLTRSNTESSLREAQKLLQRWHKLATESYKNVTNNHETSSSLIFYHLISLTVVTSFPEIERLAFREGPGGAFWQLCLQNKKCIYDPQEALVHCGRLFHFLRTMRVDRRPYWWASAIYRATLILWTHSILQIDPSFERQESPATPMGDNLLDLSQSFTESSMIAMDRPAPDELVLNSPPWASNRTIILNLLDGSTIPLNGPAEVLQHGIALINECPSTNDREEMQHKLMALDQGWHGVR